MKATVPTREECPMDDAVIVIRNCFDGGTEPIEVTIHPDAVVAYNMLGYCVTWVRPNGMESRIVWTDFSFTPVAIAVRAALEERAASW